MLYEICYGRILLDRNIFLNPKDLSLVWCVENDEWRGFCVLIFRFALCRQSVNHKHFEY